MCHTTWCIPCILLKPLIKQSIISSIIIYIHIRCGNLVNQKFQYYYLQCNTIEFHRKESNYAIAKALCLNNNQLCINLF